MKNRIAPFVLLLCCLATACHRPYALYQRTPAQTFRTLKQASPVPVADSTDRLALVADPAQPAPADPAAAPEMYASARPTVPARAPGTLTERVVRLLSEQPARTTEQTQPKPKPKAEPQRKTLREVLGLKPRKKLNWWQRISWRLKAAVVVILVAVLFAVLKITILAIIFGVIGAFLLIKGLKKSFKVRRPLF